MYARPAHVLADKRNTLFVFAPLALEPALERQVLSKLEIWGIFISRYTYVIEKVEGHENVFGDIVTLWTKGYSIEGYKMKTVSSLSVQNAYEMIPAS